MALRPGSRLLISSHFMPLPRSSMIRASSSGDHLDCFLAGDSDVCEGCRRLAAPDGPDLVKGGITMAAGPGIVIMGPRPSGGPIVLGGYPVFRPGAASSSSWGLSSSEISTLTGGNIGRFCNAIICADEHR